MSIDESNKSIIVRFIFYTLIVFGLTSLLPAIVVNEDIKAFKENGPIEWFQLCLITATSLLFYYRSRISNTRELYYLISLIAAVAVSREMDSLLFDIFPKIGWKLPVIILVFLIFKLCKQKHFILSTQMNDFLGSRVFSLLWCGFIVAVPFAQLVGHGDFLKSLMGDDYDRGYKRVIEETGELMGYLILFVGSIEAIIQDKFRIKS